MFRSVQRVSPSYLDPKQVYLWSEMIIKLREAKVKMVLFPDPVTEAFQPQFSTPLPYHVGSAHHLVTHPHLIH